MSDTFRSAWCCSLISCALSCRQYLVTFLIEEGANVHDVDSYCNKFSLLHDAARRGNAEVVQQFLVVISYSE